VAQHAAGKYLPMQWMFYFREALTESIGREAANAVLRAIPGTIRCPSGSAKDLEKSADFSCYGALCASVSEMYGAAGARTILTRSGRTAFNRLLQRTAAMVGADHPGFPAGSAAPPLAVRMQSIVRLLGMLSDVECACEPAGEGIRFLIFSCPECADRTAPDCLCHGMAGMVQAAVDWFGGGTAATAAEIRCQARGDPHCEFAVAPDG
jgi:predicted hydrocarbon binding protein